MIHDRLVRCTLSPTNCSPSGITARRLVRQIRIAMGRPLSALLADPMLMLAGGLVSFFVASGLGLQLRSRFSAEDAPAFRSLLIALVGGILAISALLLTRWLSIHRQAFRLI